MAIALDRANVGTLASSGLSASIVVPVTNSAAAGSRVFAAFGWADKTVALNSVADSGPGLSWSIDATRTWQGAGGNFNAVALASANAPAGISTGNITGTLAAAVSGRCGAAMSLSGVVSSSPLDGSPGTSEHATSTAWAGSTLTLTAGSVLVTVCWAEAGDDNTGMTSGTQAVDSWEATDNFGLVIAYNINAAGGSTQNAGTFAVTSSHIQASAAYLADAGGGDTGGGGRVGRPGRHRGRFPARDAAWFQ